MRKSSAPTAAPVEAVYRLVPPRHRLALLWLDCSGARVSSVDLTTVGDDDEPRRRVRLRAMTTKIRRALWLELPNELAEAVGDPRAARGPRLGARLFADSGADALRTSIAKACKAAGSRCSHRTTCVTAGSRSCTSAVCRGRGSTSWSVSGRSRSPRTPTRTSSPTRRSSITRASGRFGEQRDRVSAIASPRAPPRSRNRWRLAGSFESSRGHSRRRRHAATASACGSLVPDRSSGKRKLSTGTSRPRLVPARGRVRWKRRDGLDRRATLRTCPSSAGGRQTRLPSLTSSRCSRPAARASAGARC